MLSDEEKEIFNNLKEYMQNQIDNGYHKFIYNDLDWDFKCIDCINAIDNALKQSKEIEHQIEKRANQRNELAILNAKQIEFNKLVNIVNSYKGQFKRQQKEIEELNKENTRQHELIGNIHKKWEDKIKAKIEEYEKALNILLQKDDWIEPSDTIIRNKFIHYIEFGQSLLEKE